MMDETLYDNILQRRDLPLLVERVNHAWNAEKIARVAFRDELTPSIKAEFILGKTILHSPAKAKHLRATQNIFETIRVHLRSRKIGEVFTEKAMIALGRNDYEPDIVFFSIAKSDFFTDDQLEFPAPDFIVEVLSDSTEKRDRGVKFEDYAEHGVGEYWIVDCDERAVEQYVIGPNGQYRLAQKVSQSVIGSVVVVGFQIPVLAIFDDNAFAEYLSRLA